jgi:hypothetical protein
MQKVLQSKVIRSPVTGRPMRQITDNYIFQASELPSGELKLAINTTDKDPDFRGSLKILYETITRNIDQEGLDFLKRVLEQD